MSGDNTTSTETTSTEGQEPEVPETPEVEAEPKEDDLPEWVRKELTKVRGEAANYRTRLREAETRLSEAKTPEEFEAALAEVKEKNAELERSITVANVARKYQLPDALAARLQGSTAEELEKDAKELVKLVVPAAPDPESLSGGLTPDSGSDDLSKLSPRELAAKHGRRR